MTVLETISKLQDEDEATARLLLRLAMYDALCDEIDTIRPQLDGEVNKMLEQRAAKGLVELARQPVSKGTIEAADALIEIVSKDRGPNWDYHGKDPGERDDETGRFVPKNGNIRQGVLNAIGWAIGAKDNKASEDTRKLGEKWTGPDADKYSRASSLGAGLIATNNPNARPAGTVLRLVGDIGPEAQRALEPGIRRTAYRYRGTERRPDAKVQEWAARISEGASGEGQDRKRLAALSNLGVSVLLPQIPDKETAAISLEAGKMPPSVGLMFDGRGRLVSEAMGFNGDHYLPFDLKNLKRLHGGSYVRTRTTGGLTDEDIYTGLMTGARHMTVVSNSGVFTLEFDPTVRGGRRYSDKARQMVDRYSALVSTIGSGKIYQNPLPQEQVAQIRRESLKAAGGRAAEANELFKTRLKEAQAAAAFTSRDDDELRADAEARVMSKPQSKGLSGQGLARAIEMEFTALRQAEAETSARAYRLDGEGYKAALKALQTEFPYFIRSTNYTPLQKYMDEKGMNNPNEPRRPRGGTDMGYTRRNELAPSTKSEAARTGRKPRTTDKVEETEKPKTNADGSPAAGGGGDAPAAAPTDLKARLSAARKDLVTPLYGALAKSLVARTQATHPDWLPPTESTPEQAMSLPADMYVAWYAEQNGGDWAKIANKLADEDPKVLDKFIAAIPDIQRVAESGGIQGYDQWDKATETLQKIRKLKQPFVPADDLTAAPELEQTDPFAVPEVLELGADEQAIKDFVAANDDVGEDAVRFMGMDDKEVAAEIREKAVHLGRLQAWLKDDLAVDAAPYGIEPLNVKHATAGQNLKDLGEQSPEVLEVKRLHAAWALKRLAEVVGATRGTGAAVPLEKAAKAASPGSPSRVRVVSKSHPLARALASQSPSPRLQRLPASH